MKRETKLRPSMSWDEIAVTISALETTITGAIVAKQVTLDILAMTKVKKYLETFKPANVGMSEPETLAMLMAKYGITPAANTALDTFKTTQETSSSELPTKVELAASSSTPAEPMDDETRYDMLKLMGEDSYTAADIEFMNGPGFIVMMGRTQKKPVKVGDL